MINQKLFDSLFMANVVLILYFCKKPKGVEILQQFFIFTQTINEFIALFQNYNLDLFIIYLL